MPCECPHKDILAFCELKLDKATKRPRIYVGHHVDAFKYCRECNLVNKEELYDKLWQWHKDIKKFKAEAKDIFSGHSWGEITPRHKKYKEIVNECSMRESI